MKFKRLFYLTFRGPPPGFTHGLIIGLSKKGWSGVIISDRIDHMDYPLSFGNFKVLYTSPSYEGGSLIKYPSLMNDALRREIFRRELIKVLSNDIEPDIIFIDGPIGVLFTQIPAFFSILGSLSMHKLKPIVIRFLGLNSLYTVYWEKNKAIRFYYRMEEIFQQQMATKTVFLNKLLFKIFPRLSYKAVYIPIGIDIQVFSPMPRPITSSKVIVSFVGRLSKENGIHTFIEAVKKVKKDNVKFLVVGSGPLEYLVMRELKGFDVQILSVAYRDMPQIYAISDVVVSPTFLEWPSTVTYEAMACGKCVIKSKGGIDEIITDGVNGLLFKPGNAEELAEKIRIASQDEHLRRCCGENARTLIVKKYNRELEVSRYDSLFLSLIS